MPTLRVPYPWHDRPSYWKRFREQSYKVPHSKFGILEKDLASERRIVSVRGKKRFFDIATAECHGFIWSGWFCWKLFREKRSGCWIVQRCFLEGSYQDKCGTWNFCCAYFHLDGMDAWRFLQEADMVRGERSNWPEAFRKLYDSIHLGGPTSDRSFWVPASECIVIAALLVPSWRCPDLKEMRRFCEAHGVLCNSPSPRRLDIDILEWLRLLGFVKKVNSKAPGEVPPTTDPDYSKLLRVYQQTPKNRTAGEFGKAN